MSDSTPHAPSPVLSGSALARDLRIMMVEGACFTLMQGFGENYLQPFALAMGLAERTVGLFYMLPNLIGALMQLVSPWGVTRLGSNKRWAVWCVGVQAASFVPLAAAAWIGHVPVYLLFLLGAIYWGAGMAAGPAWATWIGGAIPAELQSRYFGRRSRAMQFALLAALLTAGLILPRTTTSREALPLLGVVFVLAGLARCGSCVLMAMQHEVVPIPPGSRHVSTRELLARMGATDDGRFIMFLLAMQVGAQFSGPYVTPFLLGQLRMSYLPFTLLVAAMYLAKMLTAPLWGQFAHRFGPRRLFWVGAAGLAPLPAMWLISWNYAWLLAVQMLSGAAWCAYELAQALMFFRTLRPEERTSIMTKHNVGNALAGVLGVWAGGQVLAWQGGATRAYMWVFGLAFVVRLLAVAVIVFCVRGRRGAASPQ